MAVSADERAQQCPVKSFARRKAYEVFPSAERLLAKILGQNQTGSNRPRSSCRKSLPSRLWWWCEERRDSALHSVVAVSKPIAHKRTFGRLSAMAPSRQSRRLTIDR